MKHTLKREYEHQAEKKPYSKPVLTVYGTINQITKSTTNGKNSDGGTGKLSMQS